MHSDRKIKQSKVVVIGGGTGTSVVLEGLKKYPVELAAIITTADDGSSSGTLRKKYQMIPPGDIRQCLVALASGNYGYLNESFQKGFLQGHTLGNLLITLFHQRSGNFQEAIDDLLKLVGAQGSLLPMTLKPATLMASLKNGKKLIGEKNITSSRHINGELKKLSLRPASIAANPRAIEAIRAADVIIVGPGNLFSSILPVFLVAEIKNAFLKSKAKKIYVANLFTQPGHTDGFSLTDFLRVFAEYFGKDPFTHIIYHNQAIPNKLIKKHSTASIHEQVSLPAEVSKKDKRFIGASIFSRITKKRSASDPIAKIRNPFLHDSQKLAKAISKLL